MDLKKLLNEKQYEAVETIDGPVLVLAGAGSGKTRVLTYRIANMIQNYNIYPSNILAITFTNKAAQEMRERVKNLIGDEIEVASMWISTFHSTCVRILRREIDKLGYNKNFTIYDSYDSKTLIKQCMKELNINDKDITDREIASKIGSCKDAFISARQYKLENEKNFRENKIADVYELYQRKLKENNALDFDDLIYKTVELFKKNEDVLGFYQRKFKYIMVDEYQDTNGSQYLLTKLLASEHKNLFVVGDDDQSIYGWRGADIKNILDFEKDYEDAKIIKLEENYRSKANILNAANSVIGNNPHKHLKTLRTNNESGEKIKIYRAHSDKDEADFVCNEMNNIMKDKNKKYNDFAILYRTNAQSRLFEEKFLSRGIPYRLIGGLKFYDRKEIKDIMSYLKVINNSLDSVALERIINVPKRNIGDTTVNKLKEYAEYTELPLFSAVLDCETIPTLTPRATTSINKFASLMSSFMRKKDEIKVSELIDEVIKETGYVEELKKSNAPEDVSRIENLKELVSAAVEFEKNNEDKSLAAFLELNTLNSDVDNYDEDADAVVLMTVHSAKGLEFPVVYMVGMENGIFPGTASFDSQTEMEESRRLCYVGITRAKEMLYMTHADYRMVYGKTVSYAPSDFISEINKDLKEYIGVEKKKFVGETGNSKFKGFSGFNTRSNGSFGIASSKPKVNSGEKSVLDPDTAAIGLKVKHQKFGEGTIVSLSKKEEGTYATIAFMSNGVKVLRLDIAPLQLA